jgi:hypothetical protein
MKQRIRPLLLFKKRNALFQRVRSNTFALANRLQAEVPADQSLRAVAGWTGLQNCYDPVQAKFGGASALYSTFAETSQNSEGMISMWINTTGVLQALYDIGDLNSGTSTETTRLLIDGAGQVESFISHSDDGTLWATVADVPNIGVGDGEWHHYYMAYKNDTVGDLDDKMQVFVDGVQVGLDVPLSPTDDTISFIDGDGAVIGASHAVLSAISFGYTGALFDIWTKNVYMEPVENIPFFRSAATNAEFVNGTPRPITSTVNGVTANLFMGGQGYTLADWNAGLNVGLTGDYTLVGDDLTEL